MTGPTLTITLDQAAVLFDSAVESRARDIDRQEALMVLARFLDEHRLGSRTTCLPRYSAVEHAELTAANSAAGSTPGRPLPLPHREG